jgi:hypothetical protein
MGWRDPQNNALRRCVAIIGTFAVVIYVAALATLIDGDSDRAIDGLFLGTAVMLSAMWIASRLKK